MFGRDFRGVQMGLTGLLAALAALMTLGFTGREPLPSRRAVRDGILTREELFGLSGALPFYTGDLFSGSGHCNACHGTAPNAMRDSEGNDVAPPEAWRSTMMANSFIDPLFQAKIEFEVSANPELQEIIEDKCLTCHAPATRTEALYAGSTHLTLAQARLRPMSQDGVTCTVCHQIQPDGLGTVASFSGHYTITDDRTIFGPYEDVLADTMEATVDYTPTYGEHMIGSELCASCHTLFTPFLDSDDEIAGEFPEQVPFLEWLNSVYASGPEAASCQECHMPLLDEEIVISSFPAGLDGQSPFWQHHFVGGNAFMLRLMRDNAEALGTNADANQFDVTIERTLQQLTQRTASLEIFNVQPGDPMHVTLAVTNHTGHKFPTGYPARRAWIHLRVLDETASVIFESGAHGPSGEVIGEDPLYESHHNLITSEDQVQIYEMVAGDTEGAPTNTLLRMAQHLKDNRLPPRGFVSTGASHEHTAVAGLAASDENFNRDVFTEGNGRDLITYVIAMGGHSGSVSIEAELVYQSVPPRFTEHLLETSLPAVEILRPMLAAQDNSPIVVGSDSRALVNEPLSDVPTGWLLQ